MESVDFWEDSQYDSVVEYDASMNPFVKDSICLDEEDEEHVVEEDARDVARYEQVQDECMIVEDTFAGDELMGPVVAVEEEEVQSMAGNGEIAEQKVKDGAIKVNDDAEIVVEKDARDVARYEQVQDECMIVEDTFDSDELMGPVVAVEEEEVQSMAGNGKIAEQKVKDGAIKVNDDAEIVVIDDEDIVVIDDEDFVVNDQEVIVVKDCDEEKGIKSTKSPCTLDFNPPSVEDVLLPTNDTIDRDFDLNKLPLSGMMKFPDPSVKKDFIEMLRKYQSKYY